VARSSVIPSPGDFVIPAVCGVVVVDGTELVTSDSTAPRPATATELALRVIPLINNIKTQLVDVQLALDVLPAIQLAIKELKDGYIALDLKYGSLADRLVKTDVAVKILDDWSIAYDFSRTKKVSVSFPVNVCVVAPMNQAVVNVVGSSSSVQSIAGIGQVSVVSELVEMSISDIDIMFY